MTVIIRLAIHITLYDLDNKYVPCDRVLPYDKTYSEDWYPNYDRYKIYKSMKPERSSKVGQQSSTAFQKIRFVPLAVLADDSTLSYSLLSLVSNK